jgi:hypothetical protein
VVAAGSWIDRKHKNAVVGAVVAGCWVIVAAPAQGVCVFFGCPLQLLIFLHCFV